MSVDPVTLYAGVDLNDNRVRNIPPSVFVSTFAGSMSSAFADGLVAASSFGGAYGLPIDALGKT